MNWLRNCVRRIRTWWNNNHNNIVPTLVRGIDRIVNNIVRLIVIGIILNVVSAYFYPDFPERFPTIYAWFDGWVQLGEFAIKASLSFIYSFFTGNLTEFWTEYTDAFNTLWQQFTTWLGSLHF